MTASDRITFASVLVAIMVPILGLLGTIMYKLGGLTNDVKSLSETIGAMNIRLEHALKIIYRHDGKIKRIEREIAKLYRGPYKP